jgi:hypothetical protein
VSLRIHFCSALLLVLMVVLSTTQPAAAAGVYCPLPPSTGMPPTAPCHPRQECHTTQGPLLPFSSSFYFQVSVDTRRLINAIETICLHFCCCCIVSANIPCRLEIMHLIFLCNHPIDDISKQINFGLLSGPPLWTRTSFQALLYIIYIGLLRSILVMDYCSYMLTVKSCSFNWNYTAVQRCYSTHHSPFRFSFVVPYKFQLPVFRITSRGFGCIYTQIVSIYIQISGN